MLRGLDQELAVQDALAAAEYMRSIRGANGKVGAVGYCLGGKLAYLMAMHDAIDAAASYYGVAIQGSLDQASKIQAPLLLHIAECDHLCPSEAQQAIADAMEGKAEVMVMSYPDVGHAFARQGGENYNTPAAERADAATARPFEKALR